MLRKWHQWELTVDEDFFVDEDLDSTVEDDESENSENEIEDPEQGDLQYKPGDMIVCNKYPPPQLRVGSCSRVTHTILVNLCFYANCFI